MITVAILVNGHPVMARSAVNTGDIDPATGRTCYRADDGSDVWHHPEQGAVRLAHMLLDTLREYTGEATPDPPTPPDVRLQGVEVLGLSARVLNALKRGDVLNVGHLVSFSADEVLEMRNVGVKGLAEVRDGLARKGLKLRLD